MRNMSLSAARDVVAGVNLLVAGQRAAVQQIQRFAFGHIAVRIKNLNFGNQSARIATRKPRTIPLFRPRQ